MNEHSGGAPKVAFVPSIGEWSEESFEVHPIIGPEYPQDDILDVLREEIKDPDKLREALGAVKILKVLIKTQSGLKKVLIELLHEESENHGASRTADAIRRVIGYVRGSAKPQLTADQIWWIFGGALFDGLTVGQLAKRNGISKQAFQQGARKLRESNFQVRSQSARPEKSRARMRLRNSRRTKHERVDFIA